MIRCLCFRNFWIFLANMLTSSGSSDGSEYSIFDDWSDRFSVNQDIHYHSSRNLYKWLILLLYCLATFSLLFTHETLFGISDILCDLYSIERHQLVRSSDAFLVIQTIALLIGGFYASRYGLCQTMVVGSGISVMSTSIYFAATQKGGYPFFLVAVVINSLSHGLLQPLPPLIISKLFPEKQRIIATNIAITFGGTVGIAGALLIRVYIFSDPVTNIDINYVEKRLLLIVGGQTALAICIFTFVISFVRERRSSSFLQNLTPVSLERLSFSDSIKCVKLLMKSVNFHFSAHSMAVPAATIVIVPTILHALISQALPKHDTVNWLIFASILSQLPGVIVISIITDRSKRYKLTASCISLLAAAGWLCFSQTLQHSQKVIYLFVSYCMTTFFSASYPGIVIKVIHGITYPIPPYIAYTIVLMLRNIYIISLKFLTSWLIQNKYHHHTLWLLSGMFLFSFLLILLTRSHEKTSRDSSDQVSVSSR